MEGEDCENIKESSQVDHAKEALLFGHVLRQSGND